MKALKIIAFWILLGIGTAANAQNKNDSLGLPGDNLDLNAVLSIFKDSKSPEDFEKKLNAADTKVNNLDLNHDGKVDYLRVVDYGNKDLHSVVIKDPVSASETQDVAVIEVEKKGNNEAHVQIVGDEDLYGKNYIITPAQKNQEEEQANPDDVYYTPTMYPYVNVWTWPCVAYMYSPAYVFWVSPWYWGYYPGWWSPWSPYGWWTYRQGLGGYYDGYYYRRTYTNHMPGAHRAYYNHRVTSGYVEKTNAPVNNTPHYGRFGGNRINRNVIRPTERPAGNRGGGGVRNTNGAINGNRIGGGGHFGNGGAGSGAGHMGGVRKR